MKSQKIFNIVIAMFISITLYGQQDCNIPRTHNLLCEPYKGEVENNNDYTKAIQLAISNATNEGGGTIILPGNRIIYINTQISLASNIKFTSTNGFATIKYSRELSSPMFQSEGKHYNVSFENIIFDGAGKNHGIKFKNSDNQFSSNISITNCEFKNMQQIDDRINPPHPHSCIIFENVRNIAIENCTFKNGDIGIDIRERCGNVKINDNIFEKTLTENPIKIHNTNSKGTYSDHVWITNNRIEMGRAPSIIDELPNYFNRDSKTGRVSGLTEEAKKDASYVNWKENRKGANAIYTTCGSGKKGARQLFHQDIFIEGNIINGPDYGFFNGGTGDLFGIKDVIRLHCVNNTARNSGDIGFSIERCIDAVISNNIADRNNSCGIVLTNVKNSIVSNNICRNNALRRDLIYNAIPYGGIMLAGTSNNNLIEGNNIYSNLGVDISYKISDSYTTSRKGFNDFYGIIIRKDHDDTGGGLIFTSPYGNTIGFNNYLGYKLGPIYDFVETKREKRDNNGDKVVDKDGNVVIETIRSGTIFKERFVSPDVPKNIDYPLDTKIWNSNIQSTSGDLGWKLKKRLEFKLLENWSGNTKQIKLDDKNKSDEINKIEVGDLIGILLQNGGMHWTSVDSVSGNTITINNTSGSKPAITDRGANLVVVLEWMGINN